MKILLFANDVVLMAEKEDMDRMLRVANKYSKECSSTRRSAR